ncbi:MAG: serine hydrolase [Patescibacteria group bacterium]|jgi:beta-lactamase class A
MHDNNKKEYREITANKVFIALFIFLLIGGVIGFGIGYFFFNSAERSSEIRQGGYQFISPLLECESNDSLSSREIISLEKTVSNITTAKLNENTIDDVSVYYRDLNNGPWYGVNQDALFAPASLLKVPMMIALYKRAETDPSFLSLELVPEGSENGETVDVLIEKMIVKSENYAFDLLSNVVDFDEIRLMHDVLDIPFTEEDSDDDYITVRKYSSLFRVLYNASYLNREFSEKALALLARAEYDSGIAKNLPGDLVIANKFGIRSDQNSQRQQLHDCGVVYYPDHPYLLCIMTKGNNVNQLEEAIQDISKSVYDEINTRYRKY